MSATDDLTLRVQPLGPEYEKRLSYARLWSLRLSAMFDTPAKKNATGRLWRMRFFQDGDYLVATMTQALQAPPGVPSDQAVKIMVFLVRPYHRATSTTGSVMTIQLAGQYSVDELIAFLRLDTVDPESAEWVDETKYSDILVVGDLLRNHVRSD